MESNLSSAFPRSSLSQELHSLAPPHFQSICLLTAEKNNIQYSNTPKTPHLYRCDVVVAAIRSTHPTNCMSTY